MPTATLDLIIPAHNEEEVIIPTICMVSAELARVPDLAWTIIVAENGSSDRTYEIVRDAHLPNVLVFQAEGRGKGAAIKEAITHATGEYFGFIDADCSPHPRTIEDMLAAFSVSHPHLVIGSRFHPESAVDRNLFRHGTSALFNLLARTIVGVTVDDTQCGLKIMNRDARALLASCAEQTWFFDLELIARAERSGFVIQTVPVEWTEFRYPERRSKLRVAGDGARAILHMFRLRRQLAQTSS